MRLVLALSVLVVAGCQSAPPPADASAQVASKNSKEMSDLLRKADALAPVQSKDQPPAADHAAASEPVPTQPDSPRAPAKSKTEVMREQAVASYGDRLSSLRRTAEAARLKKDRYQQVCQRQTPSAECQQLTADVSAASKTI